MTATPNQAPQRTPGFGVQLPSAALIRPAQSRAVRPAMKPGTARAFALRRRAHSRAEGFLTTWTTPPPRDDRRAEARERQQSIIIWGGVSAAVAAALLAAWAWRAPAHIRFHAAFITGLALLAATYAYIRHMQSYLDSVEDVGPTYSAAYAYLITPSVGFYSTALAHILILSALYLDRT